MITRRSSALEITRSPATAGPAWAACVALITSSSSTALIRQANRRPYIKPRRALEFTALAVAVFGGRCKAHSKPTVGRPQRLRPVAQRVVTGTRVTPVTEGNSGPHPAYFLFRTILGGRGRSGRAGCCGPVLTVFGSCFSRPRL